MFSAAEVKEKCNGMLPLSVYEKIYQTGLSSARSNFLEVGTAHGAATVCLAQALRDGGHDGKVYTFEKIVGGSREEFGGVEKNIEIIRANLSFFGVEDKVELIIGDVRDCAHRVPMDIRFGILFLDADGCIDRDFGLFFQQLDDGGAVFIDDVMDRVRIRRTGYSGLSAVFKIDQKHKLSYELLQVFRNRGLLDEGEFCGPDTWVGKKLSATMESVPAEEVLDAYRTLVFADAKASLVPFRNKATRIMKLMLSERLIRKLKGFEAGS